MLCVYCYLKATKLELITVIDFAPESVSLAGFIFQGSPFARLVSTETAHLENLENRLFLSFLFPVVGIEPRALCMLSAVIFAPSPAHGEPLMPRLL